MEHLTVCNWEMMTSQTAKVPNLDDLGITLATFASRNPFERSWGLCSIIGFNKGVSDLKHGLLLYLETDRKRSRTEKREHPLRQEVHTE